jgi:hypothetical protein
MSGIHPVSSKEHMLSPTDIFVVAAHEYKAGIEECREAAKKAHITAERMSYSVMIKEYSDPRLLRVRAGNTLFTIAAMPHRVGFVRGYNGDTAENYIANMGELPFFEYPQKKRIRISTRCLDVASKFRYVFRRIEANLKKSIHFTILKPVEIFLRSIFDG